MTHAFLHGPSTATNQFCSKTGYTSRRQAMKQLKKHRPVTGLSSTGVGKLNVYKCKACHLFHLGHQ